MLSISMKKNLEDGKKIATMFDNFSEQNKMRAIVYMSALREKEIKEITDDRNSIENIELSIHIAEPF